MPLQAITATEPIPGYRIRERIGAGGYGEVWTADAPGGLVKAIKFVYGFLDEDRASRELKALNRIKAVRHPFLLSLERIEVVDGQLLIVTELAEASLKERFDEYRKEKQTGIPWDELIQYLQDAADVLDYMSEVHSLQHLDIKPENLLMLAGRVKVADFGLVKDIHDATASLMGGLTPLYAPPEVFDGRPSRWSDQYSLAIVYQEMLTGELPFPGTTAIQLARQHLNARPRISALPERDQGIIARALSKSPPDRFGSCRELVDALQRAAAEEAKAVAGRDPAGGQGDGAALDGGDRQDQRGKSQTEVLDEVPMSRQWFGETEGSPIPRVDPAPTISMLPPIEISDEAIEVEPTLFLGVGRSAGRIMLHLRRRLADRFGHLEGIPALQMLLLDTDGKDLLSVSHERNGLQPHQLVGTPLRRPQDYRNDSRQLLQWLSRRWLYNIPKSLKTEGLRPLGRLALVDHIDDVTERIRAAITLAGSEDAVAQSVETTGLQFGDRAMRIVVISSISGGTGSGMVADLGYLARHLLGDLGFPDDNVCGVLTHSTGRNPRSTELSVVNAYSALSELNHYGRLGSCYPGDRACRLPSRKEDNVAFRDTYLIKLGDGLNDQQFEDAADRVAEYLYMDTATSASHFFRACRDAEPRNAESRNAEIRLRTFGLHQFSCLQDGIVNTAIEHLCRHAVEQWVSGASAGGEQPVLRRSSATVSRHADVTQEPVYSHLKAPADQFTESLGLDVDQLIHDLFQFIEHELEGPPDAFFRDQVRQLLDHDAVGGSNAAAAAISQLAAKVDSLLGSRSEAKDPSRTERGTLEDSIAPFRKVEALKRAEAIRTWLLDLTDDQDTRVRGAQWAAQYLSGYCGTVEKRVVDLRKNIKRELAQIDQHLDAVQSPRGRGKERAAHTELPSLLEQYCKLRLYDCVAASVASIVQAAKGQVSSVEDELMDIERELRHLASQFDTSENLDSLVGDGSAGASELLESVGEVLVQSIDLLTSQLAQSLRTEVLDKSKGLRMMMMEGGNSRNKLPETLRGVARSTVIGAMKNLDVADLLFQGDEQAQSETATLTECFTAAMPSLIVCGGYKRLLVMLPRGSTHVRPIEILHEQTNEIPSVAENSDGDFILCHEVEQMSLTQVAVTLIDGRGDFVEFASRLHTRTDVSWSSLPDLD